MKTLYLNISDCIIKLVFYNCSFPGEKERLIEVVSGHYAGFIVQKPRQQADYTVKIIDSTTEISFFNKENGNGYMFFYHRESARVFETYYYVSIFQIQSLLFDMLLEYLDRTEGFIMHASANSMGGKAAIFLGKSGAGKSTIMTLLNPRFPAIASDSIVIKKSGGDYYAYQTPFFEKETWVKRKTGRIPISRLFFLHKSKRCRVEKAGGEGDILNKVIQQVVKHEKKEGDMVNRVMKFIAEKPLFYQLYFPKDAEVVISFFSRLFSSFSSLTASTSKAITPE